MRLVVLRPAIACRAPVLDPVQRAVNQFDDRDGSDTWFSQNWS
jgi:hypothetical protein